MLEINWVAIAVFAADYLGDEVLFYVVRREGTTSLNARPRFAKAPEAAKKLLDHYGTAYMFCTAIRDDLPSLLTIHQLTS